MAAPRRGTVILVDDDAGLRTAMTGTLEQAGFHVETYESAETFLPNCCPQSNACIVLDIRLNGMTGIELQQELLARKISIPILFMTGYANIPQSVQAIKAGAVDFLEKPVAPELLLSRIAEALAISRHDASTDGIELAVKALQFDQLTLRERQVSTLVAQGRSNKEIARELNISFRTVEKYRASAMKKLHVKSSIELARAVPPP